MFYLLFPCRNVIVGREYDLFVEIFDSRNNRIFPSDNIVMEVDIPQDYFSVHFSTSNGTLHSGRPLKPGTADVAATLIGVRSEETGELIEIKPHLHASGKLTF